MIRLTQHRSSIIAGGVLAVLVAFSLPGMVCAAEDTQGRVIVGLDRTIFGTKEAADLVAKARAHDPMYCPRDQTDRDKAAQLYEEAIAAQPGAKINAKLADRVAQMYAFYEDREKGVRPDRSKANQWWQRCIESTDPNQLVWAQAQMGLASTAVIGHDFKSAIAFYNRIFEIDVDQVALPDWKAWPEGNSEQTKAMLEHERAFLRQSIEGLQGRAVEKLFYVLCRATSRFGALGVLENVAAKYNGTPVGARAAALMAEIHQATGTDPLDLLDLATATAIEEERPMTPPQRDQEQEVHAPAPVLSVAAEASGSRRWGLAVAIFAVVAVVMVGAGIVWFRNQKLL